jgi:hypothetical protein
VRPVSSSTSRTKPSPIVSSNLATEHSQVQAWPDGNPDLAHQLDHRDWIYDHIHPVREVETERAFDRLNPDLGVPADQHNPYGRQAVRNRETALALGVRVAVHDSRENDPNPVIWQPGQDYRAADAIQAARRPQPGAGAAGRTRRRLQRRPTILSIRSLDAPSRYWGRRL